MFRKVKACRMMRDAELVYSMRSSWPDGGPAAWWLAGSKEHEKCISGFSLHACHSSI